MDEVCDPSRLGEDGDIGWKACFDCEIQIAGGESAPPVLGFDAGRLREVRQCTCQRVGLQTKLGTDDDNGIRFGWRS